METSKKQVLRERAISVLERYVPLLSTPYDLRKVLERGDLNGQRRILEEFEKYVWVKVRALERYRAFDRRYFEEFLDSFGSLDFESG